MVLEKSLEVFQAKAAEQEAIYLGTELLEGEIRRSKESTSDMFRSVIKGFKETGLG